MTREGETRRRIVEESYDDYLTIFERLEALVANTEEPRSTGMLLDVAGVAGVSPRSTVLDAGCRDGAWTARIADRFGCVVVGIDVAGARLAEARDRHGLPVARADVGAVPLSDSSVDFVWCREVLSVVEDPIACLREFTRVLRPGPTSACDLTIEVDEAVAPESTEWLAMHQPDELIEALDRSRWPHLRPPLLPRSERQATTVRTRMAVARR